jgi:hypothetical protein
MKTLVLMLILGISPIVLFGQLQESDSSIRQEKAIALAYTHLAFGMGSPGFIAGFGIHLVFNGNIGIGVVHRGSSFESNYPDDYHYGWLTFWSEDFYDRANSFSFMLNIGLTPLENNARWKLGFGPSASSLTTHYFRKVGTVIGLTSNYEAYEVRESTLGFSFEIGCQWALGKTMGIDVGFFTNRNSLKSITGLEMEIQFGKLRK